MSTMVATASESKFQAAWRARRPVAASFRKQEGKRRQPPFPPGTCALAEPRPLVLVHRSPRETLEGLFSESGAHRRGRSRPALSLLVLGPQEADAAGFAKGLARGLFGSDAALVEVSCGDYRDGRRAAELLGVPAGESRETRAFTLGQRRLDSAHLQAMAARRGRVGANASLPLSLVNPSLVRPLSVVLFDEIESAHPILRDALLEILQTGRLVLGDGSVTSFAHSIVVITSGAGEREIGEAGGKRCDRNCPLPTEERKAELVRIAGSAANASFPADFLSRIDEIHVARPAGGAALERAFERLLLEAHARIRREGLSLSIRVSPEARNFILERGRHILFGPRRLCWAMEAELVEPLLRLVRAGSLRDGDVVEVVKRESRVVFFRNRRGSLLPA